MNHELEFTEPERYELREGPYYHFEMNRREFGQVLGAGLLLSVALPSALAQRAREERTASLAQRLHIGADGIITVLTSKVEVGQGSRTQLTQAAAEELRVPVEQVRLIMADTELTPDDGGTAGSRTTPSTVPAVRKACAAARELLAEVAAKSGEKSFSYANLADAKYSELLKKGKTDGVAVTEVKEWRVLGTPIPRVAARDIVTGSHRYPSDIRRPGMLYGKVLRPESYGAKLEDVDLTSAEDITALRDGDFVGFAAPTSFAAETARAGVAKTAKWKAAPHPSSDDLYTYLRENVSSQRPRRDVKGSPDEVLKQDKNVVRQSYHIAYIQHVPMEPRAAVAEWVDGKLTVWTGTQQPSRVREELTRAFNLSRERVRVIVPDTGGGFGGKHSGEVAVEAARLAKEAKKPVSVRWTREEEFTWAYFRPAGVIDFAGALDEKGSIAAWEQVNFNAGASALATPYAIANVASEFKSCEQPLRSGSYRALASTANIFARESFMDELAAVAKADPLEFRLRHLANDRLRAVLVAAADRFDWKKRSRKAKGIGIACGTEKGSYTACCARVEVDERAGTFRPVEVCVAFECGAIQNPANLKAQVEGCIIQGLGGALKEQMRFREGKIQNASFSQYQVPRFKNVPAIETVLVNRPDLASVGAGETPIVGIAPAIGNALSHAVGVRIRSLPLRDSRWRAA